MITDNEHANRAKAIARHYLTRGHASWVLTEAESDELVDEIIAAARDEVVGAICDIAGRLPETIRETEN